MNPDEKYTFDELNKAPATLPSDAYFAQLKSAVLAQLPDSTETKAAKVVPLYRKWWALSAAAAGVVLVVSLFLRNGEPVRQAQAQPDWNSVSREEVLAYIDDNIDDFEAETLASHLDSLPSWNAQSADTTIVAQTSAGNDAYDDLFEDIDREDILEYLQEEAVEIDDELLMGS